ncbi:MAG TPA: MBL fold metallo-hydrolase [Candidatus Limnocylindria bacterium]|jgi:glyoxylase-like metal-dependent hydrolase (beta-lactamase superfamily II)|nr:MBL fold metallo-hydrolase [Candidatus Limnocylindria bacterium]
MEIAPGVHAIRLLSVYAFLIDEPQLTLIDAGLIGSAGRVQRYVQRMGRSLDDLARIICTHAHPDHIGGVRELAGERDIEVLMHPADLDGLKVTLRDAVANRNRSQLIAYFTRHPGEATPIEDGQVLPILGGLRVIHTPGHTPGSVCLYAERHRLLFVGDNLQVIRRKVTFASSVFSDDMSLARASVARMAELDVATIVFSHYPAWRDGANEVLRALADRAARPERRPSTSP